MITVQRELHPRIQNEADHAFNCTWCSHPTYVSVRGVAMSEVRQSADGQQLWRSEDNGRTWNLRETLRREQRMPDGSWAQWHLGPFFLDPDHDLLVRFESFSLFTRQPSLNEGYHDFVATFIDHSYRVFYRISRDAGLTWGKRKQLIEDAPEYDEQHWAWGVTIREGAAVLGAIPPFPKLADGRIMLPMQRRSPFEQDRFGTIQASCFFGRWTDDLSDIRWTTGGTVHGGGCEQTIAALRDGRLLNIMRVQGQITPYLFDVWRRPYALSENGGETWSIPQPLDYDDGTQFTTPRAWSQLIRSTADGNLYWIANILPALDEAADLRAKWPSRADPRYPLQIARINEETLTLERDSVTTIVEREPGETEYVRFSNFYCYNDRETDEIVLIMVKSYHEDQPDQRNMPHPAWRFRIKP